VAITLYILWEAYRVMEYSALELLDRALPTPVLKDIQKIINEHHPKILGFHDMRTRKAGSKFFIEFHIEIRGERDFNRAHEITETLIERIEAKIPNSDITLHYDP